MREYVLGRPVMVIGHPHSGKTFVAKMLGEMLGVTYGDSSHVMFPVVEAFLRQIHGLEYDSWEEMHEDRIYHRNKWRDAIHQYALRHGLAAVGRLIFEANGNDIYCGCREVSEFQAMDGVQSYRDMGGRSQASGNSHGHPVPSHHR